MDAYYSARLRGTTGRHGWPMGFMSRHQTQRRLLFWRNSTGDVLGFGFDCRARRYEPWRNLPLPVCLWRGKLYASFGDGWAAGPGLRSETWATCLLKSRNDQM